MSFHGLLLVNKPAGITSHDVVYAARRKLGIKSIGHTGTLDPFATGLMVLVLGEATKLSDYLRDGDKAYECKVKLGLSTKTGDITGEVVRTENVDVSKGQLEKAILKCQGHLELPVPIFSAIKKQGKKLYEYARDNQEVELPIKSMSFFNLKILNLTTNEFSVHFHCSKGSYVRSWAQAVGQELNVPLTVETLHRTHSSVYHIDQAIKLDQLSEDAFQSPSFIPMKDCLPHYAAFTVKGKSKKLLTNGQIPHELDLRLGPHQRMAQKIGRSHFVRVLSGDSGELLSLIDVLPNAKSKIRRSFVVEK
ncbi:MAG: tRNA pseudouridine(55) synthase TruB [Bdellovibrionales bacterium]|nr:tRNA pseudouridine(55) synthase TruB [Bdellovibrionales bacterium]